MEEERNHTYSAAGLSANILPRIVWSLRAAKITETMLVLTESVRREVLLPEFKRVREEGITVAHKGVGAGNDSSAKTITVEADNKAENCLIALQEKVFPDALIIGEEMFGRASTNKKLDLMQQVLTAGPNRLVLLNDALDGTRDFVHGKDGFGSIVSIARGGNIEGVVMHLATQHYRRDQLGYTLSWECGDAVRIDGVPVTKLDKRPFPAAPGDLRGYADRALITGSPALTAAFNNASPPKLRDVFDSLSDLWTCGKLYRDLLAGEHHFMVLPTPVDIFDHPGGVAMLRAAGGVARFVDGTDATLAEIFKRQGYGKLSYDPRNPGAASEYLHDPANYRAPEQSLILAVSEPVYETVRNELRRNLLDHRRAGQSPATP